MTTTTQELEAQLLEYINKNDSSVSFEQKEKDLSFDQSLMTKTGLDKSVIVMGVGAGASGLLAGTVASVLPLGSIQAVAGLPTLVAGSLGIMTIGKTGMARDFFKGVLIAGISQTVSRFIPSSFSQEAKGFSQEMKEQFKQEQTPCNDVRAMRPDVTW